MCSTIENHFYKLMKNKVCDKKNKCEKIWGIYKNEFLEKKKQKDNLKNFRFIIKSFKNQKLQV